MPGLARMALKRSVISQRGNDTLEEEDGPNCSGQQRNQHDHGAGANNADDGAVDDLFGHHHPERHCPALNGALLTRKPDFLTGWVESGFENRSGGAGVPIKPASK